MEDRTTAPAATETQAKPARVPWNKGKIVGAKPPAPRVDDVAPSGYAMDRATIRQKKTGRPVRFELTDQTRQAIDDYLRLTGRKAGQFLFAGRRNSDRGLTTRQ